MGRPRYGTGKIEKVIDLRNFPLTGLVFNWFGLDPDDAPLLLRNAGSDQVYALTLERK